MGLAPYQYVIRSRVKKAQQSRFGIQLAHIFDRNILRDRLDKIRSWQPKHLIIARSPWLCLDSKEVMQFIDSAFD